VRKTLLVLSSLLAYSGCANAEVYVDANFGANTSWSSPVYNVNGGYKFNNYIGVEGGISYSPQYKYSWGPGYAYNTDYWLFDGAVKGILPLTDIFSLYGKLGLGLNNYTSTWNGCNGIGCSGPAYSGVNLGVLAAAGVQFDLSSQWSLHVEDYTVTGSNPNFFVFGGEFNF
jgi:opacity protein-like surface antigen